MDTVKIVEKKRAWWKQADLALNKPTTQSSFYQGVQTTTEIQNPNRDKNYSFHTDRELNPWWRVDLEAPYLINSLVLYNRPDVPSRLKYFTILFSLDGEKWVPVYSKSDEKVFGETGGKPYEITLETELYARHIMVRLDGYNYLHFQKLQVFGTATKETPHLETQSDAKDILPIVEIDGVSIYLHTKLYSDTLIKALGNGGYEGRERALLRHAVAPGDRVLEIGSATGLISMLAARIAGAENIITFEANPQMVEHARRNFELNGLSGIRIENAVLKNATEWKGEGEWVEFHISRNFWASRLTGGGDIIEVKSVTTRCLEQVIRENNSNVLICDIEGAEVDLLSDADLSQIDTIMLEIHYHFSGEVATNRMIKRLINKGFSIDLGVSAQQVVLMHRGFTLKRAAA